MNFRLMLCGATYFQSQSFLNFFLPLNQFETISFCNYLFFSLKMKIFCYSFISFSLVHCAVICFSVSKYSKFILIFSPISASFLLQLFVFDLQKVVNLFRFFFQFKRRSLCSNIFFSFKMF